MLFDGNLNPIGKSEYRERLLSHTIMLVLAAGGELRIPPNTIGPGSTHHVLEQASLPDGTVILRVTPATKT